MNDVPLNILAVNVSPLLLSVYINGLEYFLMNKHITGLQSVTRKWTILYLKLCNCFYTDNTVILTETAEDLQNALSECYSYGEQ